jgi:CheY-like chemotaxis protein
VAIKHALVVDDSKSARTVLRRMLEEFSLDVDAVESADDAINYLIKNRPDVIFMDHMMPGMDGFEAVKQIKKNPQTAVIPIMMYTSRGGEVYLSQARALGAVGIIPKTISPVGLKESLFKLGLIDDRRQNDRRRREPVVEKPDAEPADRRKIEEEYAEKKKDYSVYLNDLNRLMDDQTIELHKSMWLGVESVSNEIFNRLHGELDEKFEKLQANNPGKNKVSWPLFVVSVLLLLSIIVNVLLLSFADRSASKIAASNQTQTIAIEEEFVEELNPNSNMEIQAVDNQQAVDGFIQWAQNKSIDYPFDELALNVNRLPEIEVIFQKAVETGFSGDILLQTHVGLFCLIRNQNGSFELADGDLPVTQCEYIGNHVQPIDLPSSHQSVDFANYLSDVSLLHEKGIEIEVTNIPRTIEISRYPEQVPQTTVKEWNLAAQGNNRIIIKLIPEPSDSITQREYIQ